MKHATISTIAKMTGVHDNTIRRWCDRGILESKRDFRNWRFFPDPQETVERIQGLLNGDIRVQQH